ncbi:MAG: acyltransferase [Deltaproteobacteria bacterium]|nr:acyltransferase [Deltaproteobacteria bacterium]
MDPSERPREAEQRLVWVDVAKGLSILWIAYFHLFQEAGHGDRAVNPVPARYTVRLAGFCLPAVDEGWLPGAACVARALVGSFTLLGFHAVAVFLVLSGFGLARSLGNVERPSQGWGRWYRRRLLRLFPLYWAAHLVILLAGPLARLDESLDARLLVSMSGLRLWPIETAWFYFNPSFWYFTLLVQLYAVFPLLWRVARRIGPLPFALGGLVVTAAVRWSLFAGWAISTHWAEGGWFAGRMAEFALGIGLGMVHRRDRLATEAWLFRPPSVALGFALWWLGLVSYRSTLGYCFTNGLIGAGLFVVVANLAE